MAFGDGSFRSRAASLLRSSPLSGTNPPGSIITQEKSTNSLTEPSPDEKPGQIDPEKKQTISFEGQQYHSSGHNAVAHDSEARRIVRTIPGQPQLLPMLAIR